MKWSETETGIKLTSQQGEGICHYGNAVFVCVCVSVCVCIGVCYYIVQPLLFFMVIKPYLMTEI